MDLLKTAAVRFDQACQDLASYAERNDSELLGIDVSGLDKGALVKEIKTSVYNVSSIVLITTVAFAALKVFSPHLSLLLGLLSLAGRSIADHSFTESSVAGRVAGKVGLGRIAKPEVKFSLAGYTVLYKQHAL